MKRLTALALTVLLGAALGAAQRRQQTSAGVDPEHFIIKRGTSFSASTEKPSDTDTNARKGKTAQIVDDVSEALDIIRRNHADGDRLDYNVLGRSTLDSALRTLDPHSSYFDASQFRDLMTEERSEYSGIGATIVNYKHAGQIDTYVVSTIPGSPGAAAKLKFGDRIISVDDQDATGRPSEDVSDAVRGENGSRVKLVVERAATGRVETLDLRRAILSQPSIRDSFMLSGGVGYIGMTEGFNFTTAEEFSAALKQLKRSGATSLVIDLRDNPGGILEQAVKVAEKFLPAGDVIVSQRGRSKIDNHVWKSNNRTPETMPLVLLVNENTASASEIFAGALQDHDRAFIIGQRTFGKGLVQSVYDTPYGSGLTLTTARYYTPSGRCIQRDYTKGDLYDYYNHRLVVDPQNEKQARTAANRVVYGGDGITPDDPVDSKATTDMELDLLDKLFFFSRDAVNRRAAADVQVSFTGSGGAESLVDDKLINDFKAYAEHLSPGSTSTAEFTSERRFVAERLKYNLVMALRGETEANRILIEDDPEIARAVSQLPKAKELTLAKASARNATVH